jgi:hypothetical protein
MTWIMRPVINNRTNIIALLHKHDNLWIESYQKEKELHCCKCDDHFESSPVALLGGVVPRPNRKVYCTYLDNLKKNSTEVFIGQETNSKKWGKNGHKCDENTYVPILYKDKIICPNCLTEAIRPNRYKTLMAEHKTDTPLDTLLTRFSVVFFHKRKPQQVSFILF